MTHRRGANCGAFGSGSSFSPASLPGLYLWVTPDGLASYADTDPIDTWADESGNGNDCVQATGSLQPACSLDETLGAKVLYMNDWDTKYLSFPRSTSIRYLAGVARFQNGYPFVLGDPTTYHWHSGTLYGYWWNTSYSSAYIRNGTTLQNDVEKAATDGRSTNWMQFTVRTTGGVAASRICRDRSIDSGTNWARIAEYIICTSAVGADDDLLVRTYLKDKYGL